MAVLARCRYLATTSTSRLTLPPCSSDPSVVRSSVSGINETSNVSSPRPETVRLTPSTAIEPRAAIGIALVAGYAGVAAFISLGGNFLSASPDTGAVDVALDDVTP